MSSTGSNKRGKATNSSNQTPNKETCETTGGVLGKGNKDNRSSNEQVLNQDLYLPPCYQPLNSQPSEQFPNGQYRYPFLIPPFPAPPYPGSQTYQHLQPASPPSTATNTDMQTKLIELVNKMDSRLQSIEKSVSKLNTIQNDISHLRNEVSSLKSENHEMKTQMNDMETFCQTISDLSDNFNEHKYTCSSSISALQRENKDLKTEVQQLNTISTQLNEQVSNLRCNGMRDNLLFIGIKETNDENCEESLRNFLTEHIINDDTVNPDKNINIDNVQFKYVNRIGGANRNLNKPRPIVAKFVNTNDRDTIKSAGVKLNMKKKGTYINEQYPPEIETRRRELFPVLRRYKQNKNNKCFIVRDKLYVNNRLYDPVTDTLCPSRSNFNGNSQHVPERTSRPRQRSPSFRTASNNNPWGNINFATPNRFASLMNCDSREQSPVRNKHKANSPLEEALNKRSRDNSVSARLQSEGSRSHGNSVHIQLDDQSSYNNTVAQSAMQSNNAR